jgi:arabinan endo-1,5-alpha-L-arabinosidase
MNLFARARVAALGAARRNWPQQSPQCALALSALLGCSTAPDIVAREPPDPGEVYDPTHPPKVLDVSGDVEVHDPTIAEFEGRFYLFQTGSGILSKTSSDLSSWQTGPNVFAENPAWIADSVPGVGALWSPAVATFGGRAHLYYAASTFGDDRSCIGHASKPSLASDEAWTDQGSIVCSNTGSSDDDWNAIDPGVLFVEGTPWLVFGSYLSGIKLVRLDSSGGQRDGSELYSLATRTGSSTAIQQPFLLQRGGYYYLFSSFDGCCMGVNSTHKIMVGRSAQLVGPYLDRDGTPLLEGGGTLLLESDERFHGPGSNAILFHENKSYNVYHAYDVNQSGRSLLRIAELVWDDAGWPISGGP